MHAFACYYHCATTMFFPPHLKILYETLHRRSCYGADQGVGACLQYYTLLILCSWRVRRGGIKREMRARSYGLVRQASLTRSVDQIDSGSWKVDTRDLKDFVSKTLLFVIVK